MQFLSILFAILIISINTSTAIVPSVIQEASQIAFPHIQHDNNEANLWLHGFSILHGYKSFSAKDTLLTTQCKKCVPSLLQTLRKDCISHDIALCIFTCVALSETKTEIAGMAHLTLAHAYRIGHFPGHIGGEKSCLTADSTKFLHHLRSAADYATQHVQLGLAKSHDWAPIYDEHRLSSRDKEHQRFGSDSEEKFKLLQIDTNPSPEAISQMSKLAQSIASTKYSGSHSHEVSQQSACEWYETSVELARRSTVKNSNSNGASLVMLAQCYTSGSGGFPKNEQKGVKLLQECIGTNMDLEKEDKQDIDNAANAAKRQCMSLLGTFTLWGNHGVVQDIDRAEALLEPAANAGDAFAMYGLGMLFFLGFRNNTNRNYKIAAQHLEDASNHGYLLANSYLGSMYLTGHGKARDEQDPDSVDTLVKKDVDKATECYLKLTLNGGAWGDPDSVMTEARKENGGGAKALIAFEMKATLGYSFATSSSGYLWDTATSSTKILLEDMCVEVVEGQVEEDTGILKKKQNRLFRYEPSENNFEHHEKRAMRWWRSASEHHSNVKAGTDALLFSGVKYSEKGKYAYACEKYAKALSTLSSSSAASQWSKTLVIIGWHLLLHQPCYPKDIEHILNTIDATDNEKGDEVREYGSSKLASLIFDAASKYEKISAMKSAWNVLSFVASALSWVY